MNYVYKCERCGEKYEDYRGVEHRNEPGKCLVCGGKTLRDVSSEVPSKAKWVCDCPTSSGGR